WVPRVGGLKALKTKRLKGHLFRVIVGGAAPVLFFLALTKIPFADVTVIVFCSPFILTVLAVFVFGDRVGIRRWIAIAVGFLGVTIALQPGPETFNPNSIYALGAAFAYAGLMIAGRHLSDTESTFKLVYLYNIGIAIIATLILPFVWVSLNQMQVFQLAGMAVFAVFGHLGLTYAFNNAPTAVVSPFEYTSLVWATLLGFIFWDELPGVAVVLGAAIIVTSGLYSIYRETRIKVQSEQA
ncbi:MAG: DMT family transporter, partial [Rhodospirillales bacterium]|nr:DMT family transporter [Rhodospirillales bacterium]